MPDRPALTPDEVLWRPDYWREITRDEAFGAIGREVVIVFRSGGWLVADWFEGTHPLRAGVGPHALANARYFRRLMRDPTPIEHGRGSTGAPVDRTPTPGAPRPGPPPAKPTTWVEIELIDNLGVPVSGEEYVIELPDGTSLMGALDAMGCARVDGIDPGTCKIEFPNIDGREWKAG